MSAIIAGSASAGELATLDARADQLVAGRAPRPHELGVGLGELVAAGLRRQHHRDRPPDRRALEHREVAARHARGGRRGATRALGRRRALLGPLERRHHQVELRGVAAVDRGLGDAGAGRDPLDRQAVVAELAELVERGVEDRVVGLGAAGPARRVPASAVTSARPPASGAPRPRRRPRPSCRRASSASSGAGVGRPARRARAGRNSDHDEHAEHQHARHRRSRPSGTRRRTPVFAVCTSAARAASRRGSTAWPRFCGDRDRAAERVLRRVDRRLRRGLAGEEVGDLAAVDRRHDAADDRDAERATHLAGGVVDRGADAGLGERQRAHDRVGRRRHHERHAHGEDHEPPHDVGVRRVDAAGR